MRVVYDFKKKIGSRVLSVNVKCRDCDTPKFVPIEEDKDYRIAINSYISGGGSGFDVIRDNQKNRVIGMYTCGYKL